MSSLALGTYEQDCCNDNVAVLRGHNRATSFLKKNKKNLFLHSMSKKFYLFLFLLVKIKTCSHSFTTGGTMTGTGLKRVLGGPKSLEMCSLFLNLDRWGRNMKFYFSNNKILKFVL